MKEQKHQPGVTLLVLLRALVAACALRDVLDQDESERVCSLQLGAAMGQLVLECEPLISDRECLIPLALLRQRVEAFVGEEEAAAQKNAGLLQFARYALTRLIARLWALLDIERRAAPNASDAAKA